MTKKPARPEPPAIGRRIIVEELQGQWSARFEGNSESAFGGDSPGTAVDRLWENWLNTGVSLDAER